MGATSTGTPKRVRRVRRSFSFQPTFLLGTCDMCHRGEVEVNELTVPKRYSPFRGFIVCWQCALMDRTLLYARAAILAAITA